MTDDTTKHAAEVTADVLCDLSTMGCDEHRNVNGDDCLSLLWYHELGDHIADALAAAGLLADPATDTTTPEQRAVIEAAKALIEKASESAGCSVTQAHLLPLARAVGILERRRAAVDRLTATEEAT